MSLKDTDMNNDKKTVILCESYASIKYPLYRLAQDSGENLPVIFIPGLEDLYRLLQVINEKAFDGKLELIYCPPYAPRRAAAKGLRKILFVIPDILGERRHLKKFYNQYFAGLGDAEVLFPSPGYSGAKIYVLNRLRQKNRLTWINPGPPYMGRQPLRSLRDLGILLIYKMVYGKEVQLGQFPAADPWDKGFPLFSDSFMKNSVSKVIDWSRRDEIMQDFPWEKFRLFDTAGCKVIYFHQDLVNRDVPDREKFMQELKSIFDVVLRHYPEKEIARKYHPGHPFNKDVIEVGEEIPAYIPAEFLYGEKVRIYLGISSFALVNVRGGQAVSLINLLTYKSEKLREQGIEFLKNASREKILFPKTLEELEKIVSEISRKKPG